MRKINKIWYVIWLIIGLSLLISGCPFKSGIEGKAWFRYASKFDQDKNITVANTIANKDRLLMEHLAKKRKIKQKFLQAKQPTETEIISVLRSPNRRFQRVGLVAMSIKPIETNQLIDILIEFLRDKELEIRWYALESLDKFTKFPDSRKADLGKQLLEIIKTREDNELLSLEISLLAKFPSEEAALFLTEQLMKEGKDRIRILRYYASKALKKMGDSYYDEAAEHVDKHGSPEIKKELLERENYWKTENGK